MNSTLKPTDLYLAFIHPGKPREVYSPQSFPPPPVAATTDLIHAMRLIDEEPDETRRANLWAQLIEDVGASRAHEVFTTAGHGPLCSWCGTIGAICGHLTKSALIDDQEQESA